MKWFKFYGQDFLTDPKIRHLSPIAKLFWVIILSLANSEDKEGKIQNISEGYIFDLAGLDKMRDEWDEEKNFLKLFEDLKMIKIVTESNVTGLVDIIVINFNKRQNQDISNAERQRRFRERQKAKSHENEVKNNRSNVTLHNDSNARLDKNRLDKIRIDKKTKGDVIPLNPPFNPPSADSPIEKSAKQKFFETVNKLKTETAIILVFLAYLFLPAVTLAKSVRDYSVRHIVQFAKKTEPAPVVQENASKPRQNEWFTTPADTEEVARSIASKFGINPDTFVCVLKKESGLYSRRTDKSLKCGDNDKSCGLGQIQYPTWRSIRRHAGWSQDDLRGNDMENLKTTAYGLKNGWKYHWTGYRTCEKEGYYL